MKKKIKVILDSDVANEIDDQFALAYAFAKRDIFEILGVTIAPYRVSWQKNVSIKDGMFDSKNDAYRILRLFGLKHTDENPMVYLGCSGFLSEGYNDTNPAVEKIIKEAKSNSKLWVCCLGTLTNVAMAIRKDPKIAKKIKIVWLGTDNILLDKFSDANYRKDVDAFEEVLKSDIDVTIFPVFLARTIVTSTYEFERNAKKNNITKHLRSIMDRFVFTEENMGIKTIYDLGPVAYMLYPEKFETKKIEAEKFVKSGKLEGVDGKLVNCVLSVPKHSYIWTDFLQTVNSVKNYYFKPNVFFVSDTHFGHESKVRRKQVPFHSVEEMDKELVKRWNNVVGPNDIVYHLGDFGDYSKVKSLNGKITLICGNYEKYDYKKDFAFFREKLLDLGFAEVIERGMYLNERVFGEKVYLTHKPTDRANDAFTLFGHVHSLALVKSFGFNVAVGYHYFAPVNQETAKRYLAFVKSSSDEDVFA